MNLGNEPVQAVGSGTSGQGAIDNSSTTAQVNALTSVTLAGDTTFGTSGAEWDLHSAVSGSTNGILSTSGHAYKLTKVGTPQIAIIDTFVDPALGSIDILSGPLVIRGATSGLGDPNYMLTVESGATLATYNVPAPLNKQVTLIGTLEHVNSTATFVGPMLVSGSPSQIEINTTTTLNLNGPVSGSGLLSVVAYPGTGGGTLNFNGTNSFTGGFSMIQDTINFNGNNAAVTGPISVGGGALYVNSLLGGPVTSYSGTSVGGTGDALAPVEIGGTFSPGPTNSAGTCTAGNGITFDGTATLTFDLAAVNTVGSGVNDLLIVTNGDLTVNGNNITINILAGSLQPGTYRLINYTGNLNGSFGTVQATTSLTQTLTLDATSTPGQVNLIVSGVPDTLKWNTATSTNWDTAVSTNWLSLTGNTNTMFQGGDNAVFDDTANVVTNISIVSAGVLPASITNNSSTNNFVISGPGSIGGGGKLVKLGSSTLTLNTANTISGVTIGGGILSLGNATALGNTNVSVIITNGGTLDLNALSLSPYTFLVSGAGAGTNGAIVNNSATLQDHALAALTLTSDTTFGGVGRFDIRAAVIPSTNMSTGGHAYGFTKVGANQLWLDDTGMDPALANIAVQAGKLVLVRVTTLGNPTNTVTIYSNAYLSLYNSGNTNLGYAVVTKKLVLNDGASLENLSATNIYGGPIVLNGAGYMVGNGNSMELTNVISGIGTLVETNNSLLTLTANNTYTGNTIISGGILALTGTGSIATSPMIVLNGNVVLDVSGRTDQAFTITVGQTLATTSIGTGTVNGSLTNGTGGTVSPGGAGALGTLIVTNTVTLAGTTAMDLNAATLTNDVITSGAGMTYGGTLNVSIVSGTPAAGNSFKLFTAPSYSGSFSATNLPALGAGLGWNWSPASGVLKVVQTVNLAPTNILFNVSGSQMTLSWPADHIGWQLQVQTNTLGTGLGTNWVNVPGSAAVNGVTNTISSANGTVFYRLTYP
jgi:autotransporter-associated beta strand protein